MAFFWGAGIFAVALVVALVLIQAKPDDLPSGEETVPVEEEGVIR